MRYLVLVGAVLAAGCSGQGIVAMTPASWCSVSFSLPATLRDSTAPGITTGAYSGVTCSTSGDTAATSIERGDGFRFNTSDELVTLLDVASGIDCAAHATKLAWTEDDAALNSVFEFYCGDVEVIGSGIYMPMIK